jgi:integrase
MSTVIALPSHRRLTPKLQNGKVTPPRRRKNVETRSREYLTADEIKQLLKAAKASGRYGQRDRTMVMLMYRHGLRVSEAVSLRWDQVDLEGGLLAVTRAKNGVPSTHPLRGPELRELRELRREWPDSPYLFCSERGGPMTTSNVRKLIARLGQAAKLPFPVHPHQLRHALGYMLANDGHDTRAIQHYLGHKNIRHTVRYTELAPDRFKSFFRD